MSTQGEIRRGELWRQWWEMVSELRPACVRTRTFLWMGVCLAGMTTRKDLMGVTSIVRALGLKPDDRFTLRHFLKSSAAAGVGAALAGQAFGRAAPQAAPSPAASKSSGELRVAVIGCGAQGRVLIESILRIPSVRVAAICDIWSYTRQYTGNYLKKYGHAANVYEDFRELLAAEKDLDAAVVATPDWVHAEQANACLRRGLHVYCEKEMAIP